MPKKEYPIYEGKDCSKPRIVEDDGFLSLSQQIYQMMRAGERLYVDRSSYDFADGVDDGLLSVTRSPNCDIIDAHQELRNIMRRQQQRKEFIRKQREKEEAKETSPADPPTEQQEAE